MAKNETTLALFEDRFLAPVQRTATQIATLFHGEQMTTDLLEQLRVPGGGGRNWDFQSGAAPTFHGIILNWVQQRAYWQEALGDGQSPPNCSSDDGHTGEGDNGTGDGTHECASCAMNAWGSATDDAGKPRKGKACRESRRALVLREGEGLPSILTIPPTSIKRFLGYIAGACLSSGLPSHAVVTTFGLDQIKGAAPYSVVTCELFEVLGDDDQAATAEVAASFAGVLERVESGA